MRILILSIALSLLLSACAETPPPRSQREAPLVTETTPDCQALGSAVAGFDGAAYPVNAVRRNVSQGWVVVRLDVAQGRTINITLLDSSPPGVFDRASLEVVERLRYPSGSAAIGCRMLFRYRHRMAKATDPMKEAPLPPVQGFLGPIDISGVSVFSR